MRTWMTVGVLLAAAVSLTGCLEREEKIVVRRNGSMQMEVTFKGAVGEFSGPAAMATREGGWAVEFEDQEKEDGETERTLRGRQAFRPDEWPDTFATGDDVDVALRFPTTLTIERRRDGVYYHFERTYEPREMARYKRHQEMFGKLWQEKLGETEFAEADPVQQREAVGLLRDYELARQMEYVEAGLAEMKEVWPLDLRLDARAEFRGPYVAAELDEVVGMLSRPDAGPDLEGFSAELRAAAREAMADLLQERRVPRREVDEFFSAIDFEARRHEVTEDLSDESFQISVQLPGRVIAHDGELDGKAVKWSFVGEALMDRTHVLRATSVERR